ncbi:hypothetical protein [Parabacteroides sp. AM08-6]|uniref:hypothetical protein n=1 Tax=Parabacteroides sp. AM08-6 TaxID=2292053 RepID=UPI000EFFB6C2|nr:hypothetical protein [Parabacteroides sp. AM08-6]RHJ76897.1 hypothetical protein DW103_16470 [Parabacteroides sp. AM08-6]
MDEHFKKKYGVYDGIDTSTFKHIPEISFYNNNYYVGLKRGKSVTNDLLFAHGDDDNQVDWYIINGNSVRYIGYEFSDKGVLNLSDVEFT